MESYLAVAMLVVAFASLLIMVYLVGKAKWIIRQIDRLNRRNDSQFRHLFGMFGSWPPCMISTQATASITTIRGESWKSGFSEGHRRSCFKGQAENGGRMR